MPPQKPPADTGPDSAGQSGDIQGLSDSEDADNESVEELIEEGQYHEAMLVDAVENTPPAGKRPLRPRRRKEDDLPPEYTDKDPDEPHE